MMPLEAEKGHRIRAAVNVVLYAAATAVLTIFLAYVLGGAQADLAHRVDDNARVTRAGVDTIACILLVPPNERTYINIQNCAANHGYTFTP